MVHSKGLVVALKVGGKVLKESHETVYVPFDNEYSIVLKNLKPTQRALVDVYIDGQEAIKGLIVQANGSVELERFYDGKASQGRKFMFVEKDAAVEARRDNEVEDGLIRVEYRFERYVAPVSYTWSGPWRTADVRYGATKGCGARPEFDFGVQAQAFSCCASSAPVARSLSNDAGITERGSISKQSFVTGYIGDLEDERHSIVLSMKGFREEEQKVYAADWIKKPKKKAEKNFCGNCGNRPDAGDKFCSNCGKKLK